MIFPVNGLNRTVTTSLLTASVTFSPIFTAIASPVTLNGAGATFPAPLYEKYAREVTKAIPDLKINYQPIGSGGGVKQTIAGTVDFGASDAAMTDAEIAQVKEGVILVPTAGGAISIVYNAPGVNSLKLSRSTLPAIFSGQITQWNDPKIKADNPGVNLPNQPIKTVVRADSSGTTFIFTEHLSAISPYFKSRVGGSKLPKWLTTSIKGEGNAGVAALVVNTPGSIGYVEYQFAKSANLKSAEVQNKAGEYLAPSLESANQALSNVQFPSNYRVFVSDPGQGYPIVGMTWIMIYKSYKDPVKAKAVKSFVKWILTKGQVINDDLNYIRVPSAVAKQVINTVNAEK